MNMIAIANCHYLLPNLNQSEVSQKHHDLFPSEETISSNDSGQ